MWLNFEDIFVFGSLQLLILETKWSKSLPINKLKDGINRKLTSCSRLLVHDGLIQLARGCWELHPPWTTNSPLKMECGHYAARFGHALQLSHIFGMSCGSIQAPIGLGQQLACSNHAFANWSNYILSLPALILWSQQIRKWNRKFYCATMYKFD